MIKLYLKRASRHFSKKPSFWISSCFCCFLYIVDELSYEGFYQNAEQIVRVNLEAEFDGTTMKLATAPNRLAPFINEQLPEVKEAFIFLITSGSSSSSRFVGRAVIFRYKSLKIIAETEYLRLGTPYLIFMTLE